MDNVISGYFDLTVLLKQGVFNLRQTAAEYKFSANEFFGLLSSFVSQSPGVMDALSAFVKHDGNIETYRSVDNMATLLKELHCVKFVADFYNILGGYEQGNWRLAAFIAESNLKPFEEFCQKITAAQKRKPDNAPDAALSLKEYIARLDELEAERKRIILAVDDSPSILSSLSYVLGGQYKVYTLRKPEDLEKILKKLTPDLFLLDYEMPVLNGFDLVPIIRHFEEHKNTPIIYLTSISTIDTVTSAMAVGACDFIVKPFNPDILLEKIGKWLARNK